MAARRLQWDNLVWQVPVLSLTAQAFLLTIALNPGTSRVARIIACLLSIVAAVLAVQLMTRHRQAEIADAHWLCAYEAAHFPDHVVHGPAWRAKRDAQDPEAGVFSVFRRLPGFKTWAWGLTLFGLASLVVLLLSLVAPSLLQ
jgi:disulfide bond formation protein DsbB